MKNRGRLSVFPDDCTWPEQATLLYTLYRDTFKKFWRNLSILTTVVFLAFILGLALTPTQSSFWTRAISFGSTLLLTLFTLGYFLFRRPVIDGWAKGYWFLRLESLDSERAILWDSLAQGTTCSTFSLDESILKPSLDRISPHIKTLERESQFVKDTGQLLANLSQTNLSQHQLPIADADWARVDSSQPIVQALATCPPLSSGAVRMTERLTLPSPVLSQIDTGQLLACLNRFDLYANQTQDLLRELKGLAENKLSFFQAKLRERTSPPESPPPFDFNLERLSYGIQSLIRNAEATWALGIHAIEREIEPEIKWIKESAEIKILELRHTFEQTLSKLKTLHQDYMDSTEHTQKSLKRQIADERNQIAFLEDRINTVNQRIRELARKRDRETDQAQRREEEIAQVLDAEFADPIQEQMTLYLELRLADCLQNAEQAEAECRQYNAERGQLERLSDFSNQKFTRLRGDLQDIQTGCQRIQQEWLVHRDGIQNSCEQQISEIERWSEVEIDHTRREVDELRKQLQDVQAAMYRSEERTSFNDFPQALRNLYVKLEKRLIKSRKDAARTALDIFLKKIERFQECLDHTCSIIARAKPPARPLRTDTKYFLPVWIIAWRQSTRAPASFRYTTLARLKSKNRRLFGRDTEVEAGPWGDLQERLNGHLEGLEPQVERFMRQNSPTRRACWCTLQELTQLEGTSVSKFWVRALALFLTRRITRGRTWRGRISAMLSALRGEYNLIRP